ncbi:hypothetical protein U9M48_008288 [Paspalum notatum var. saurae]|uniref:Uncharacterized protein n=1 Tax=Paspalum notatum var. saurae TaxID=547442 RepID=A0AAQ3SNX2_PASNO
MRSRFQADRDLPIRAAENEMRSLSRARQDSSSRFQTRFSWAEGGNVAYHEDHSGVVPSCSPSLHTKWAQNKTHKRRKPTSARNCSPFPPPSSRLPPPLPSPTAPPSLPGNPTLRSTEP